MRALNAVAAFVIFTGIVCIAVGAIAIASLEASNANEQAKLFIIGVIVGSIGVGLRLQQR